MELGNKTTDELCNFIVDNVGIPLPRYDYNIRQFITEVPENVKSLCGVIGVENEDLHDTFREGCIRIITWHFKDDEKLHTWYLK